jgi:hypothetical protein
MLRKLNDSRLFYTYSGYILFRAFRRCYEGVSYTGRPSQTEGRKYSALGRVIESPQQTTKHSQRWQRLLEETATKGRQLSILTSEVAAVGSRGKNPGGAKREPLETQRMILNLYYASVYAFSRWPKEKRGCEESMLTNFCVYMNVTNKDRNIRLSRQGM